MLRLHIAGFIESDMTKDLDAEKLLPFIPLKRFGTADEVAGTACFLQTPFLHPERFFLPFKP
jgi:NAD(P)-dependent dehydrogenase (short-subunit alcohol dehydrogenase family)